MRLIFSAAGKTDKDVEDWLRAEKEISGKPVGVPKSKTGRGMQITRQLDNVAATAVAVIVWR